MESLPWGGLHGPQTRHVASQTLLVFRGDTPNNLSTSRQRTNLKLEIIHVHTGNLYNINIAMEIIILSGKSFIHFQLSGNLN